LLLRSADLLDWEHLGPIAGGAADPLGYMWECPDLLRLDGRDVLVISPQLDHGEAAGPGRWEDVSLYAVGTLDVDAPSFTREADFRPVDAGPDFYAPQTFRAEDGRTIMLGWMGMPDHAGQPSLAEKHPTVAAGWVHCLTVPRELALVDGALVQRPVAELTVLRGAPVTLPEGPVGVGAPLHLPGLGGALDLELVVGAEPGAILELLLREGPAHRPLRLLVEPRAGRATLDRSRLGTGEGGVAVGAFRPGPEVDVRVLLDHSSVEVFVDGGRLAMSARIYPVAGETDLVLGAAGGPVRVAGAAWPVGRA
jgi:beta-fructofuranosidase